MGGRGFIKRNIGWALLGLGMMWPVWAGELRSFQAAAELSGLRLAFGLGPDTAHQYFLMENPQRLVLDLQDTARGAFDLDKSQFQAPLVSAKVAQRDKDLRFTFTFNTPIKVRTYRLKTKTDTERLMVEVHPTQPEPPATAVAVAEPEVAKPVAEKPAQPVKAPPAAKPVAEAPSKGRKWVIALDAGHGGKDTGAIGPGGLQEKQVVLKIAQELALQLSKDPRFKVVLTRNNDSFIPLKERRDKARRLKADLFISIHADAYTTPEATGASVFALSPKGASSEMARFLAQVENNSDLAGSIGGVNLEDKDDVLAGVLVDLSMTATLTNSLDVGARVLREMGKITRLHNSQVEQAGFVVLKSPDVPSILVEMGFISNPQEASKLASASHRNRLAQAVAQGVRSYFATNAPPTAVAASPSAPATPSGAKVHPVVQGDSLEKIAKLYSVSQEAIMVANQMPNRVVKLGQQLKIPVK